MSEKPIKKITDIHCPKCGAPAKFDIIKQKFLCDFCDGFVEIADAISEKKGFRKLQKEKLNNQVKNYKLLRATCSGCGSNIVFEQNEAISNCSFCE